MNAVQVGVCASFRNISKVSDMLVQSLGSKGDKACSLPVLNQTFIDSTEVSAYFLALKVQVYATNTYALSMHF